MSYQGFDYDLYPYPAYPKYPVSFPPKLQQWGSTSNYPYPMNFVQAPSYQNQILITYRDQPYLQGLSIFKGPVGYPLDGLRGFPTRDRIDKVPMGNPNEIPIGIVERGKNLPAPYLAYPSLNEFNQSYLGLMQYNKLY